MGKLSIKGNVKLTNSIPSGTGDNVLTADPTTGDLGQIGTIDTATFIPVALTSGNILVGNASNVAAPVAMTGDITITNAGVTAIGSGVIVNADINASAAIALSKLAAVTVSRALVSDINGFITTSSVTSTELTHVSGVTSSIQGQLDAKIGNSVLTSNGDILYRAGGVPTRLPIGASGEVLTVSGGLPVWSSATPVPGGGTTGQYLAKNSNTNGDVGWYTLTLSRVTDVTATAAEVNKLSGALVTTAEINHLSGVTSNIQTQLNAKQATITGAASTVTSSNLTASRAVISNGSGKLDVSAVTSTELGYVAGVTSAIQTQLNAKQTTSLPQHSIWVGNASNVAAPVTVGSEGQVLTVSGGTPTWITPGAGGTVTSINASGGTTGFSFSGGPITTTGTLTMTGTLDETHGGTGLTTYTTGDIVYASAANTLSKLPIGTANQILTVIAGIPSWQPNSAAVADGDKGDITVSGGGTTWTIDNDAVTYAKIQNVTTDRLLGRDTAGSGDVEELTVGGGIEFTGTGIQTSAFTGDVTKTAGGTATTIAANVVTDTKLRQSAGLSVIGRSANSVGNVADIAAAVDHEILRRSGTSIGFGSIDLSQSAAVGSSVLGSNNGGAGTVSGILKANGAGVVSAAVAGTDYLTPTGSGAALTGVWLLTGTSTLSNPTLSGKPTWTQSAESGTNTFQTFTQAAHTGGSPVGILYTGGAHTTLAQAEVIDWNINLSRTVQFTNVGAGHSLQRAIVIQPPTYSHAAGLSRTITTAATVTITGAPVAGANTTITNAYALRTQGGRVQFDLGSGSSTVGGVIISDSVSSNKILLELRGASTSFTITQEGRTTMTAPSAITLGVSDNEAYLRITATVNANASGGSSSASQLFISGTVTAEQNANILYGYRMTSTFAAGAFTPEVRGFHYNPTITGSPTVHYASRWEGGIHFIKNHGTSIPTVPTDGFLLYSNDIVAGNAAPHFKTENGDIVKLYKYVNAAFGNTINTGDANTDAAINQLIAALTAHGLIST